MKKIFFTLFACMMVSGLFAQKAIIENFVDGKTDKETFIAEMTEYFKPFEVTKGKEAAMEKLIAKKAENYSIIMGMKGDAALYERKLAGQRLHLLQSLRFILEPSAYRQYMMGNFKEYPQENKK